MLYPTLDRAVLSGCVCVSLLHPFLRPSHVLLHIRMCVVNTAGLAPIG